MGYTAIRANKHCTAMVCLEFFMFPGSRDVTNIHTRFFFQVYLHSLQRRHVGCFYWVSLLSGDRRSSWQIHVHRSTTYMHSFASTLSSSNRQSSVGTSWFIAKGEKWKVHEEKAECTYEWVSILLRSTQPIKRTLLEYTQNGIKICHVYSGFLGLWRTGGLIVGCLGHWAGITLDLFPRVSTTK